MVLSTGTISNLVDFVFIMNTVVVWMTIAPTVMAMDSPLDLSLQIKCLDFFISCLGLGVLSWQQKVTKTV